MKKVLRIHLPGGLGNQVFSYLGALGVCLENNLSLDVCLECLDSKHTNNAYDIRSLNFDSLMAKKRSAHPGRKLYRLRNGIARRIGVIAVMSDLILGVVVENRGKNQEAFDTQLNKAIRRKFVRVINCYAYFQNCTKIMNLPVEKRVISRHANSHKFISLAREIEDARPVMMHVRLGDYLEPSNLNTIGVLSSEYYKNAILSLSPELQKREVWVFSDDIKEAKRLHSQISKRVRFIEHDPSDDPAEAMFLMTLGDATICANSTFSLASCLVNPNKRDIVVPETWTKDNNLPPPGYLPSWIQVESKWI